MTLRRPFGLLSGLWCFLLTGLALVVLAAVLMPILHGNPVASTQSPDGYTGNIYKSPYVLLLHKTAKVACSGFLCKVDDDVFIITAKHYFDAIRQASGLQHDSQEADEEQCDDCESADKSDKAITAGTSPVLLSQCYDARLQYVGYAYPVWEHGDYDIAICAMSFRMSEYCGRVGAFHPALWSYDDLLQRAGDDVYFLGACSVGDWFFQSPIRGLHVSIAPFVDKTVIARVTRGVLQFEGRAKNVVTFITVKGSGWYGCSGGPLVHAKTGLVLGQACCLEEFPSYNCKTGVVYISLTEPLKAFGEHLARLRQD